MFPCLLTVPRPLGHDLLGYLSLSFLLQRFLLEFLLGRCSECVEHLLFVLLPILVHPLPSSSELLPPPHGLLTISDGLCVMLSYLISPLVLPMTSLSWLTFFCNLASKANSR